MPTPFQDIAVLAAQRADPMMAAQPQAAAGAGVMPGTVAIQQPGAAGGAVGPVQAPSFDEIDALSRGILAQHPEFAAEADDTELMTGGQRSGFSVLAGVNPELAVRMLTMLDERDARRKHAKASAKVRALEMATGLLTAQMRATELNAKLSMEASAAKREDMYRGAMIRHMQFQNDLLQSQKNLTDVKARGDAGGAHWDTINKMLGGALGNVAVGAPGEGEGDLGFPPPAPGDTVLRTPDTIAVVPPANAASMLQRRLPPGADLSIAPSGTTLKLSGPSRELESMTLGALDIVQSAKDSLGALPQSAWTALLTPGFAQNARLAGLRSGAIGSPTEQKAAIALQQLQAEMPTIIRALGERGTLTDQDVQRALGAIPAVGDTPQSGLLKLQRLESQFIRLQGAYGYPPSRPMLAASRRRARILGVE